MSSSPKKPENLAGKDPTEEFPERSAPRIPEYLTAYFFLKGKTITCLARDFTEIGLFLQTDHLVPVGTKISLEVEAMDMDAMLEGLVVSSKRTGSKNDPSKPTGMGIQLFEPPETYQLLVERFRGGQLMPKNSGRRDERLEMIQEVKYESNGEFLSDYTMNLSTGGMFLSTSADLKPGEEITTHLEIPGRSAPLEVKGRVTYQLEEDKAQEFGRETGVGLQFIELNLETKKLLTEFLGQVKYFRRKITRPLLETLPSFGDLNEFLLPEVILKCAFQKVTGHLVLRRHSATKTIYFKEGRPIYVETSLVREALGNYLVEQGMMTPSDLEKSLQKHAKNDLHHCEIMLKGGLIKGVNIADTLVDLHENRLMNTFPWFDGTFEFVPMDNLIQSIPALPLRRFKIVFSGIEKWYEPNLLKAWMGVNEKTTVYRLVMPPGSLALPSDVILFLHYLKSRKDLKSVMTELNLSLDDLVRKVFGLALAGWIKIDLQARSEVLETVRPKKPLPDFSLDGLTNDEIDFLAEFKALKKLGFYELLGAVPGMSAVEIAHKYKERTAALDKRKKNLTEKSKVMREFEELSSWFQIAYDTLRTPPLAQIYYLRKQNRPESGKAEEWREADRVLMNSIMEIERRSLKPAIFQLLGAVEKFPKDEILQGYLGWAKFLLDPETNASEAHTLVEKATKTCWFDANLYYFLGRIQAAQKKWAFARKYYQKALDTDPFMKKALAGFTRAEEMERRAEKKVLKR